MFQKGKKNPHSGGLNIMIVGCGKVGMTLVDRLSKEGDRYSYGRRLLGLQFNASLIDDISS